MPTCPNGHQSVADDWCEVCGHRMTDASGTQGGPVPPPPPPPPAGGGYGYPGQTGQTGHPGQPGHPGAPQQGGYGYPGGTGQTGHPGQAPPPGPYGSGPYAPVPDGATAHAEICPQCRTPREAQAHFCEECRYHFLTGSPTTYPQTGLPQGFPQQSGAAPLDYTDSGRTNRTAEPIPPQPATPDSTDWNLAPPGTGGPAPQGSGHYGYPGAAEQSYPPGGPGTAGGPYPPQGTPPPYQGGPPQQPYPGAPEQSYAQGQQAPYPQPYAPPPGQPGPGQQGQAPYGRPAPPSYDRPGYGQQGAPPPQGGSWRVTVTQDREYFTAMMERSGPEGAGLQIPEYVPELHLPLTGQQITIGRRRQSTGEAPDIDLSRPPEDPGVSHQHALLVQQPGGTWAVVDQDSTNGTTVNGAEDPIQPFVPIPLQDGDRVHVGAWTTITLHRA